MIRLQVFTGLRKQALLIGTGALCHLLFTGRKPEICRWPSHVMDIAFEIWVLCQACCFFYQGFMASCLNNSSLMKGQSTKAAGSKAPPIAD